WASTDTGGDATDGHGSFCTASYIEAQRAGCLLALGRLNRAVQIYEATVPAIPPVYRRDRGVALARLASAYALAGDLEQSAQTATDALHLAESTGSVRTLREVHVVGQRLRSQPRTPSVTRLLGELAESAHP
ncbi:MAG: hypothetical protein ACRDRN_19100, partial [Sciscionella sp.]